MSASVATLTRIRAGRNPDWVALELDPEETLSIPTSLLLSSGLAVGDTFRLEEIAALRDQAEAAGTRTAALHLLSFRARSRGELEVRLAGKGHEPRAVLAAMKWLEERGYLDDAAFAVAFVRDRIRFRPRGRRGLLAELSTRGVRGEVAESAVDAALRVEEVSFADLACTVAKKWLRARSGRAEAGVRDRKLYAHLARKGFDSASIRSALDEIERASGADHRHNSVP